ncbi:DUF4136 domain-containing protein [Hymenobacter lapidiphilus]|uniref:DUF4136 domain-containing protein n=1 Tax=Hymenobacter sp. CCM 8763 TaxID=2303334 RepID=UPI000E351DCA|nr:DUF4136 domain-containing protein [Hymenobacter sp. CCM 8763]RFP64126.1 DUF4136 domain-containing protein [Hymenobacter sp. CCM 8763]
MNWTITLLGGASMLLSGCLMSQEARVESDYSYSGQFRRYRTYEFVSGDGLNSDTSRLGEAVRDAIRTRLKVQGYRLARRRPDLLINFHLFEGDMRFRGYSQDDFTKWVKNGDAEDEDTPKDSRKGYQPVRLLLSEGTLLVTLIDNRSNKAIWNGYASGVSVPPGPRGEVVLRRSVRSIFDQYHVFTAGYLNGQSPADSDED